MAGISSSNHCFLSTFLFCIIFKIVLGCPYFAFWGSEVNEKAKTR